MVTGMYRRTGIRKIHPGFYSVETGGKNMNQKNSFSNLTDGIVWLLTSSPMDFINYNEYTIKVVFNTRGVVHGGSNNIKSATLIVANKNTEKSIIKSYTLVKEDSDQYYRIAKDLLAEMTKRRILGGIMSMNSAFKSFSVENIIDAICETPMYGRSKTFYFGEECLICYLEVKISYITPEYKKSNKIPHTIVGIKFYVHTPCELKQVYHTSLGYRKVTTKNIQVVYDNVIAELVRIRMGCGTEK